MATKGATVLSSESGVPQPFIGIFQYWDRQRADKIAPAWAEFHLEELDTKLLPWTVVVDVVDLQSDYHYRFWGTERTNLIGVDMTGKRASVIPDHRMREANIEEYNAVCNLQKPQLCESLVATTTGRLVVFQSIRLPLIGPDGIISHIVSSMNYAQISAEHYRYYGTDQTT